MIANGVVQAKRLNPSSGTWSLKMDDNTWYGFYKTEPGCNEGDTVEFEYKQNGSFNNADPKSLNTVSGGGGNTSAPAQKAVVSVDTRQDSIIFQSSRKDAIQLVGIMVGSGALTLPKKEGEQYDALLGFVEELTGRFATAAKFPVIENKEVE